MYLIKIIVKLRSRSRSSPGPFLIYSRSILSHSNSKSDDLDQELMLFSLCHHHPRNFSRVDPDPKPTQTDFKPWNLDNTMKTGVLNIPAPVRMTPCPPRFYLINQLIQNRRTTKSIILFPLKSLTFKWRRTCTILNTWTTMFCITFRHSSTGFANFFLISPKKWPPICVQEFAMQLQLLLIQF